MDDYERRVAQIHDTLGIPAGYAERTGLALQREPESLVEVSPASSQRRHHLEPGTAARWAQLEVAAERDGIALKLVSAYRSVDYQTGLIQRKLERGESIEDILRVNAAPGFSEHHTGRAVDLGVAGCEPLTEAFEETDAFRWLCARARDWGFRMSYPRDNPHGIVYEPWHWAFMPHAD